MTADYLTQRRRKENWLKAMVLAGRVVTGALARPSRAKLGSR